MSKSDTSPPWIVTRHRARLPRLPLQSEPRLRRLSWNHTGLSSDLKKQGGMAKVAADVNLKEQEGMAKVAAKVRSERLAGRTGRDVPSPPHPAAHRVAAHSMLR